MCTSQVPVRDKQLRREALEYRTYATVRSLTRFLATGLLHCTCDPSNKSTLPCLD